MKGPGTGHSRIRFPYTDTKTSLELTRQPGVRVRYLKEPNTYKPVIIPDKQMHDFITLLNLPEDQAQLVPCDLKKETRYASRRVPLPALKASWYACTDTNVFWYA